METVEDIIIRAAKQYGDYDDEGDSSDEIYTRVTLADWVDYYNLACERLVQVRPDSHVKEAPFQLTANATKHSLPTECVQLIDMPFNLGASGDTSPVPGQSIAQLPIGDMKSCFYDWHTMTGEDTIQHFGYDHKRRDIVWTYPRVHASTAVWVEVHYGYLFDLVAVADIGDPADADREFHGSIVEWMLKLAFDMDTDSASNTSLALKYEQSFYNGLGVSFKTMAAMAPVKRRRTDG